MRDLYDNELYLEDVRYVAGLDLPWNKLENKSVLISGATGLLGSFLTDVIMYQNERSALNCAVYALSRNGKRAKARFRKHSDRPDLTLIAADVAVPLELSHIGRIDYVLHLASNTHPIQYATDPIGTIVTNIFGLKNMLDFAVGHRAGRFAFASSNEVYGENRGDAELFDEKYCGYIDPNTMRAGYPESKRCGEAMCQAYIAQYGLDAVIPRFTRSYGPTVLPTDSKAINQFIRRGAAGEDIVLKSEGKQYYSYQYAADSVSGLLTVLLSGKSGEAYNIAEEHSDITLKALAEAIAKLSGVHVVYELPDTVEAAGYSRATKCRLDGRKLQALGWKPKYDIMTGIERTIRILKTTDAFLSSGL